MKKQTMKRIAASIAALCICSMAVAHIAASATTIKNEDSNSSIDLSKKTFAAYKIFSVSKLTDDNYLYTVEDAWKPFIKTQLGLNVETTDSTFDAAAATAMDAINDESADAVAFAKAAYKYAVDNNISKSYETVPGDYSKDGDKETIQLGATLANGYYVIADVTTGSGDAVSAVMLNQMDGGKTEDVVIALKADQPTITKKIVEGERRVDANTATIGDDVIYEVTTFVPDDTEYYSEYAFVISDTIDAGLNFNNDVAITLGGEALTADTDYKVFYADTDSDAKSHKDTMTIVFYNIKGATEKSPITVTYSAKVNEDALVGTKGNENDAWLTYSNNPNASGDGTLEYPDTDNDGVPDITDPDDDNDGTPDTDEPDNQGETGETPKDTVETYLASFQIKKVNQAGTVLAGAEFTVTNRAAGYAETFTTDDSGIITISGIEVGTYTVEETKAPAGYNKLGSSFDITVGATVDSVALPDTGEAYVYDTNDSCVWSIAIGGTSTDVTEVEDTAVFEVINKAGGLFPTTGGIGTTIFTVLGVSMMAGAAGVFVIKRKAMNK